MKSYFSFFLLFFLGTVTLSAQKLNTDQANSSINFTIKNMGTKVKGTFSEFSMSAQFDQENLSESYFSGKAMIKSIDTGIGARNKSMQEKKYFDSDTYAEMTLVSTKLTKQSDGLYLFEGELTIKNTTKTIQFPVSIEAMSTGIMAKGEFTINRQDYGVGKSSWVMGDDVKVSLVYSGNY